MTQFDQQVSGEAKIQAYLALALSCGSSSDDDDDDGTGMNTRTYGIALTKVEAQGASSGVPAEPSGLPLDGSNTTVRWR